MTSDPCFLGRPGLAAEDRGRGRRCSATTGRRRRRRWRRSSLRGCCQRMKVLEGRARESSGGSSAPLSLPGLLPCCPGRERQREARAMCVAGARRLGRPAAACTGFLSRRSVCKLMELEDAVMFSLQSYYESILFHMECDVGVWLKFWSILPQLFCPLSARQWYPPRALGAQGSANHFGSICYPPPRSTVSKCKI